MKKCEYCNTENNEQATRCEKCGVSLVAQQPVDVVAEEPKKEETPPKQKKKNFLPILIGAVAVICIIATVIGVVWLNQGTTKLEFSYVENELFVVGNRLGPVTAFRGMEVLWEKEFRSDKIFSGIVKSTMGNSFLLEAHFEDETIFLGDETDLTEILTNKENYIYSLSASGTAFVYMEKKGNKLYYQSIPVTTAPIEIDVSTADEGTSIWFCISLEGNSIIYVVLENEIPITYLYKDGISKKLAERMYPYAFSDTAEFFYCYESGTKDLYIGTLQGKFEKLAENIDLISPMINRDFSQCLFKKDGEWYVAEDGTVVTKTTGIIDADINELVVPEHAIQGEEGYCYVNNLSGNYYGSSKNDQLFYLDEQWNWILIHEEIEECRRGEGEDVIYYTVLNIKRGGDLELYRVEKGNVEEAQLIYEDVREFCVSRDGKTLYYIDDNETLLCVRNNGTPKKIAEEVDTILITDNNCLVYKVSRDVDGKVVYDLYATKNGRNPVKINENISSVGVFNYSTAYYTKVVKDDSFSTTTLYGIEKNFHSKVIIEELDYDFFG